MIYDYYCNKCEETWEEVHPISDRDKPVGLKCEHCEDGEIARGMCAPGLSYQGAVSPIRKAGSGWNDVLKSIKKGSGRKANIDHY